MKALVYEGPRTMNIRAVEVPQALEDEVLIRVAYSGICGSELSGYLGTNAIRKPPLIFGHEFSGTVVDVGRKVTKLKAGDTVTANPLVTCGECRYCKQGRQQICVNRRLLSAALPGSNAEYVKVPERFVYPLPIHVTLEQGVYTEPVACAVRAVELAAVSPADAALIVGMGPIGQLILQVLRVYGVKHLIAADMNEYRLEQARAQGAHTVCPREQNLEEEVRRLTDGLGVKVAFDAVGATVTRTQCVSLVAPGGQVVFTGLHEGVSTLPINEMVRSEIMTIGAFAYSTLNFETALHFISEGWVGFSDGVVKVPLEEGAQWFERLTGDAGNITKVLLDPSM